jgi:hypothetical protein
MAVNASLSGYPPVLRVSVFQSTGATPGRAVVDCVGIGGDDWESLPVITTLTLSEGSTSLVWSNMKVVSPPRMRRGRMRILLDDSRWKLKETTLAGDFNLRSESGVLLTDTERTVAQLGPLIGSAAGITISGGSDITIKPPARWSGRRADDCLRQMLRDSVSRLIYSPGSQNYVLTAAGTGSLPNLDARMFRPAAEREISQVIVRSAPILFEERATATAVVDKADGEWHEIDEPDEYWTGFEQEEQPEKGRMKETAFRFWKLTGSNRVWLGHRAAACGSNAHAHKYMSAKIQYDDLAAQLVTADVQWIGDTVPKSVTGGEVFYTREPFLKAEGGSLSTEAEIVIGYYNVSGGKAEAKTSTAEVNGAGGTVEYTYDWIRPIDSGEDDMPATDEWQELLDDIADALAVKLQPAPQLLTLPGLPTFATSGRIGAAKWTVSIHPRRDAVTRVWFDHEPAMHGDIA